MIIELKDFDLRELQACVAGTHVRTIQFEPRPNGVAYKINEHLWTPTVGTVVKPDPPQRFPYIQGARVIASFFQGDNDRFVILVHDAHRDEYTVAYVRNLTDREWWNGRYCQTYDKAMEIWQHETGFAPMPGGES